MIIYRLSRIKYAQELSGYGAAIAGARWNSKGVEMVYCASNKSLAMAEVLVHLSIGIIPNDFVMLSIELPKEAKIEILDENLLPKNWNVFPYIRKTQELGDNFIHNGKSIALQVPSAVTQGDHNILLNPYHKLFREVKIKCTEPFVFDRRFF